MNGRKKETLVDKEIRYKTETDKPTDRQKYGLTDIRMDGWMDGWMDG